MATRWSELDLTGRVLDSPEGKKAKIVSYPALAVEDEYDIHGKLMRKTGESLVPNRGYDKEFYETLRDEEDPKIWASLYQQQPYVEEGAMFKAEHLPFVSALPKKLNYYITCDPAASEKETSDYWAALVCGVDHESNLYVVDRIHLRGQDAVGRYIDAVFAKVKQYDPLMVSMERCHAINVLEPAIKRKMRDDNLWFRYEVPTVGNKDKVSRAQSVLGRAQQGRVKLYNTPFNKDTLLPQLLRFPDGKHDDLVDCLSMQGHLLDRAVAGPAPIPLDVPKKGDILDYIRKPKKPQPVAGVLF